MPCSRALTGHRGLRLHHGPYRRWCAGTCLLGRDGQTVRQHWSGSRSGSTALYDGLGDPHFQFRPVSVTHDPATLGAIERFVTINSAMEVDLYGQVHAEASARGLPSRPWRQR